MLNTSIDRLTESSCAVEKKEKLCRSRGGESCAFDGAMIVLQPIADAAHIVHGPIACCGNSWEGRGTLSSHGDLYKMGFTTDMSEIDIIYGSDEKLYNAIIRTYSSVQPKAIFVYSTCVSGLIGEDIEAACKKAEEELGIRVIPVHAPGFVGPKNLGNRIAGEVLLQRVIGTGEPEYTTDFDINLIGEYNIAGDQWLIEPLLKKAGVRLLSRITGDSTFEEVTYAHRAKLNVVVCSRALINVAREMERKYKIPYVEVSFFGKTETSKALRAIGSILQAQNPKSDIAKRIEAVIAGEEQKLAEKLEKFAHLRGKRVVLYTGGVKSWSVISALHDLGIGVAAVGTKKSTFEDEQKMRELLGESAPLVEDVTAKNLLRLMKQGKAEILVAGGRNQYLAMKEGIPFVDVNQERHIAYASYEGLVNLAEQISNSVAFFSHQTELERSGQETLVAKAVHTPDRSHKKARAKCAESNREVLINPLKHSQSIGAAIALQGIHSALPIIHGAQGCSFLGKVLLTKHFREPVALASTKLFTEDVVMGSDETLTKVVEGFADKNKPDLIAILSSGLSEVKGDDVNGTINTFKSKTGKTKILCVQTPDYEGGLETGYAKAVEGLLELTDDALFAVGKAQPETKQINVLAGPHLTPADFTELREIIESFGLKSVILPDLSTLDGSREEFLPIATGGTRVNDIKTMGRSELTIAIGASMEPAAKILKTRSGIDYRVFEGISGLNDFDAFLATLSMISGNPIPSKYQRQRKILVDGMRDAHFYFGGKKVCIALEPDLSIQTSRWLYEMGADIDLAVVPTAPASTGEILAREVVVGDLFNTDGSFDLMISSSHGEEAAKKIGAPLYQMGFPVYKALGNTTKVTIGYKGTLTLINDVANLLMASH